VALLATKGGCSLEEKALVASTLITPANLVSYLIVEDDDKRSSSSFSLLEQGELPQELQPEQVEWIPRFLRTSNANIKVAVLKVGARTLLSLQQVVTTESTTTKQDGGTKIVLNSKVPNETARNIFVWTAVSMAFFCCSCFCLAVCYQQGAFGNEPRSDAPPPRPVRRRLTVQQVRENYPSFHFHPPPSDNDDDDKKNDTLGGGNDECSICLDEYLPGVRLRQLPCQHVFHSTCICRWLVERHAVCPLCKVDLYEEEEEESLSSSGEEVENAAEAAAPPQESETTRSDLGSSWWSSSSSSWPFSFTAAADSTSAGASWGMRWLSRRRLRGEGRMSTELTEPLIASGAAEEGEAQEVAAAEGPPTAPPTEGLSSEEPEMAQESSTSEEQTSSTPVEV
jgi:hypothetical protein